MANEALAPDGIVFSLTGLTGAVTDVDEPSGSPDGLFLLTSASNSITRASYPTPTGNPNAGAGLQNFKVWVRKDASGGGDPLIDIQVSRLSTYENRQYTIGLRLTGSAQNVITEPYSQPAMSKQDVLSFLLLDQPSSSSGDASGAALALGLQQLAPGGNGILGLDEVSFETNNANEAAMVAGKRINDKLYVRYVFGSSGEPGAFRIRYSLGRGFSLESSTGSQQSLDLIYLIDR